MCHEHFIEDCELDNIAVMALDDNRRRWNVIATQNRFMFIDIYRLKPITKKITDEIHTKNEEVKGSTATISKANAKQRKGTFPAVYFHFRQLGLFRLFLSYNVTKRPVTTVVVRFATKRQKFYRKIDDIGDAIDARQLPNGI